MDSDMQEIYGTADAAVTKEGNQDLRRTDHDPRPSVLPPPTNVDLQDIDGRQSPYKSKQPQVIIPGLSVVSCPDMLANLSTRFPGLGMLKKLDIASMHTAYISRAHKLANEANQMENNSGIPKHKENAVILREMRQICMEKIKVLETGGLEDIDMVFKQDEKEDFFVQALQETDALMREQMLSVWSHLDEWGQLLRLKLMWLTIAKQWRIEKDFKALEGTLADFGVGENEQRVADLVADLLGDLSL